MDPQNLVVDSIYLLATGQIVGQAQSSGCIASIGAPLAMIPGALDGTTTYIVSTSGTPTAAARPPMGATIDKTAISANGTDTATISGVPNPATLSIDGGAPSAITDGEVEFTATVAGTYTLALSAFPAMDASFTVVAT